MPNLAEKRGVPDTEHRDGPEADGGRALKQHRVGSGDPLGALGPDALWYGFVVDRAQVQPTARVVLFEWVRALIEAMRNQRLHRAFRCLRRRAKLPPPPGKPAPTTVA